MSAPHPPLTQREHQIMVLIAQGLSCPAIARLLGISASTVRKHRTHLLEKTGRHNAAQLTCYAVTAGFCQPTGTAKGYALGPVEPAGKPGRSPHRHRLHQ
ncbi:response regulator transcription factor [Azotobacter salinestris]|uniref:response regulator transcription factor n=1 Tax=Azotobacter salinestris TaxID=69964 RepID=UPI003CC788AE